MRDARARLFLSGLLACGPGCGSAGESPPSSPVPVTLPAAPQTSASSASAPSPSDGEASFLCQYEADELHAQPLKDLDRGTFFGFVTGGPTTLTLRREAPVLERMQSRGGVVIRGAVDPDDQMMYPTAPIRLDDLTYALSPAELRWNVMEDGQVEVELDCFDMSRSGVLRAEVECGAVAPTPTSFDAIAALGLEPKEQVTLPAHQPFTIEAGELAIEVELEEAVQAFVIDEQNGRKQLFIPGEQSALLGWSPAERPVPARLPSALRGRKGMMGFGVGYSKRRVDAVQCDEPVDLFVQVEQGRKVLVGELEAEAAVEILVEERSRDGLIVQLPATRGWLHLAKGAELVVSSQALSRCIDPNTGKRFRVEIP